MDAKAEQLAKSALDPTGRVTVIHLQGLGTPPR